MRNWILYVGLAFVVTILLLMLGIGAFVGYNYLNSAPMENKISKDHGYLGSIQIPSSTEIPSENLSEDYLDKPKDLKTQFEEAGIEVNDSDLMEYNSDSKSCPEGFYLEDGVCVNGDLLVREGIDTKEQYDNMNSNSGNKVSNSTLNNASSEENNSGSGMNTSEDNLSMAYDLILTSVDDSIKNNLKNILGDREKFKDLAAHLSQSKNASDKFKDIVTEFGNIYAKNPSDVLDYMNSENSALSVTFGSALMDLNPVSSGVKSLGSAVGSFSGAVDGILNPSTLYLYEEDSDNIIERVGVLRYENSGDSELKIKFTTLPAMFAYTYVAPLTVYFDVNNDGKWDYKYLIVFDDSEKKYFYNVINRSSQFVRSYPIKYDADHLTISFELNKLPAYNDLNYLYFWVGEESTKYRYPSANDIVINLNTGELAKNAYKYRVYLLNNMLIKNSEDPSGEGEIYLNGISVVSPKLSEIDDDGARLLSQVYEGNKSLDDVLNNVDDVLKAKGFYERLLSGEINGAKVQSFSFPIRRWVPLHDGWHFFHENTFGAYPGVPVFAALEYELAGDDTISLVRTIVYDDDKLPSDLRDGISSTITSLIISGLTGGSSNVAEYIIYGMDLVLSLYKGEVTTFDIELSNFLSMVFERVFGGVEVVGSPSLAKLDPLNENYAFRVKDDNVDVSYRILHINVPNQPFNIKVNLDRLYLRENGDWWYGEFYSYLRVCTAMNESGYTGGYSYEFPYLKRGFYGSCNDPPSNKPIASVGDHSEVAKNIVLMEEEVYGVPFVYFEYSGWDMDREDIGDYDDFLGALGRTLLLDESNFRWSIDSNIPEPLVYSESTSTFSTDIDYTITVSPKQ